MEADDGNPASGGKELVHLLQYCVEVAELVIDLDPQSLEDPGRRVDRPVPEASGDTLSDKFRELPGGFEGNLSPGLDDPASNPATEPLFAVFKKCLGEFIR